MKEENSRVSQAFFTFRDEAPKQAAGWADMVQDLAQASALDKKTGSLAYLAVLAAFQMENGIPFHVGEARKAGASREEVVSALLIGLPAAGHRVTAVLPAALSAFDK